MTKRHHLHHADLPLRRRSGNLLISPSAPHGYQTGHTGSSHSEPDSRESPGRKRIAVACSRCRKRKIKCTGDPGNGSGCLACRNSNQSSGPCQFLRVNAQEIPNVYGGCLQPSAASTLYSPNTDITFYNTPIPVNNGQGVITGSRFPRQYISNLHYGTIPMVPEGYGQHGEGVLESLRYESPGTPYSPLSGNAFTQAASASTCYHQALASRGETYDADSLKYATSMQLGNSENDQYNHFPTMDGLISTLPTPPSSLQRTLPDPRGCSNAPSMPVDGSCGEQILSVAPSILKSQSYVPLAPVSSSSPAGLQNSSTLPSTVKMARPDSPSRRPSSRSSYCLNEGVTNSITGYSMGTQMATNLHSSGPGTTGPILQNMSSDLHKSACDHDGAFNGDQNATKSRESVEKVICKTGSHKNMAAHHGGGKRSRQAKSPRG